MKRLTDTSLGVMRRVASSAMAHIGTRSPNVFWHKGDATKVSREELFGHRPATVWLTGFSGAGKSTLAYALEKLLLSRGHASYVLDGDNLRHHLNGDLGFSPEARRENIRRAAEVARLMNEAGLIVITAFISPTIADRAMARSIIGEERFVEVHVNTPLETCESRDPKGLYVKARQGVIPEFTGVSAPYEAPESPTLRIDTRDTLPEESVQAMFAWLAQNCLGNRT